MFVKILEGSILTEEPSRIDAFLNMGYRLENLSDVSWKGACTCSLVGTEMLLKGQPSELVQWRGTLPIRSRTAGKEPLGWGSRAGARTSGDGHAVIVQKH